MNENNCIMSGNIKPYCKTCIYCKCYQTPNAYRYYFWCEHPNQKYIQDYFKKKRMVKSAGFLGFGKSIAENTLPIKKAPAWCPYKKKGAAVIAIPSE